MLNIGVFFTPTLLILFSALNLIGTSYFDSHSWGLFTTMISITEEKISPSFTVSLEEKQWISSVMGSAKLPISIYTANKELELLMPLREIGLSEVDPRSSSQKYLCSLPVSLVGLHTVILMSEPKIRDSQDSQCCHHKTQELLCLICWGFL